MSQSTKPSSKPAPSALDKLADIERRRAEARAAHPDVAAFIDYWKGALSELGMYGSAVFGKPRRYENAISSDRMCLAPLSKPKSIERRSLKERFVK